MDAQLNDAFTELDHEEAGLDEVYGNPNYHGTVDPQNDADWDDYREEEMYDERD